MGTVCTYLYRQAQVGCEADDTLIKKCQVQIEIAIVSFEREGSNLSTSQCNERFALLRDNTGVWANAVQFAPWSSLVHSLTFLRPIEAKPSYLV